MSGIIEKGVNVGDVLSKDGYFASVTEGVSMWPLFKTHRDMVVLQACTERLKKYDVALYRGKDKYVLHRIIGIDESRGVYIIRGDNTYSFEYVKFDSVIAKLIKFNRKGKHREVTDLSYRIYVRVWNFIYPIRRLVRGVLIRVKRLLFKKKSEEV